MNSLENKCSIIRERDSNKLPCLTLHFHLHKTKYLQSIPTPFQPASQSTKHSYTPSSSTSHSQTTLKSRRDDLPVKPIKSSQSSSSRAPKPQRKHNLCFCFCVLIGKLPAVILGYHTDGWVPRRYGRRLLKMSKDELSTMSLLSEFH